MKAHGWSCMLCLLCMPSEVMLQEYTASQYPSSHYHVKINASAEITCSTSVPNPSGLYLQRAFPTSTSIVYLFLKKGQIDEMTPAPEFADKIHVSNAKPRVKEELSFTLQLSLMEKKDTNLYICSWRYLESATRKVLNSNGTIIIVQESGPEDYCETDIINLTFICLAIFSTLVILICSIGALIFKCTRFGKTFTPSRAAEPPILRRPAQLHW